MHASCENFSDLQRSTSMRGILYRRLWQFSNEIFGTTVISALFLCNVIAHGARYRALIFANVWRYLNYIPIISRFEIYAQFTFPVLIMPVALEYEYFFIIVERSVFASWPLEIRGSYGEQIDGSYMYRFTRTQSCTMIAFKRRDS